MNYEDALKQVLVDKIQEKLPFKWLERKHASYYYDQHLQFIAESVQDRQYDTDICRQARVDRVKILKYYFRKYLPHIMKLYDAAKK